MDDDDEAVVDGDVIPTVLEEGNSFENPEDVATGVSQLAKARVIAKDLTERLTNLNTLAFKRIEGTSLPMFEEDREYSKQHKAEALPFC